MSGISSNADAGEVKTMSELIQYKCPNCGGSIEFDSTLQKMKCPYCDSEFDVETLKKYDEELKSERGDDMKWESPAGGEWKEGEAEGINIYVCQSCGGEIVCDENTAALSCPYCDSPVVMKGKFAGELKPDYVIPFRLDKKAAKEAFYKHLKGKLLLPKVFRSENHIDEIKGIYVPFWLFDSDVEGDVRYKATRISTWSDSHYNYTKTSHFAIYRSGQVRFQRIPVDGSSKIADELMESIEPFRFEDAVDFQTAYLAGYLADKYDVSAEESIGRANERIRQSTVDAFKSTVQGYNTVVPENSSIRLSGGSASYALYPVWILNTTWRGQKYMFAMNGQTGKFVGDLPLDKGAYARWLAGLTVLIGLGEFLLMFLRWAL